MLAKSQLTRASVSCGSKTVSLFRFKLFTCSNTKLKYSSALTQSLSRNDVTTSCATRNRQFSFFVVVFFWCSAM